MEWGYCQRRKALINFVDLRADSASLFTRCSVNKEILLFSRKVVYLFATRCQAEWPTPSACRPTLGACSNLGDARVGWGVAVGDIDITLGNVILRPP